MSGMRRREFLGASTAALLGGALPVFAQTPPRRIKGVIWLWMGGGMSQIDTWDPKPGTKYAGGLKAIDTALPGVQVCELLPKCASEMKRLTLLRTICSHEGSFERGSFLLHTGRPQDGGYGFPSIGTILAHELGDPASPLPKHIAIDPPLTPRGSPFGPDCLPFTVSRREDPIPNVRRQIDQKRDRDRTALLRAQDKDWATARLQEEVAKIGEAGAASDELMNTPHLTAFDVMQEPVGLRAAYGDRFGTNLLLARRLIQHGCAFVEVGMGGWAIHSDMPGNMKRMLPTLDSGLSTLVRDLADQKLLQDVLVVLATEFGRTPAINSGKGRDHHTDGFSVVLAGGGLKGGQVYGDTGPDGATPTPRVSVPDLHATIYGACGVDARKTYDAGGRTFHYVDGGTPIAELF
jgi:hypothetical protein